MYVEKIRGYPYKNIAGIAQEFGVSTQTVKERLQEIREQIKQGRYSRYAVIADGRIVLINVYVFVDYLTYRQQLKDKNMSKHVPMFQPRTIAEMCGWEV
ncbi:MAG: hypothetical protein R3Y58_07350 [Eubacteriales bacterium]